MSDRSQQVASRPRKAQPRKPSKPIFKKRRRFDAMRWLRIGAIALGVGIPLAGYYVAASSYVFRLRNVEVTGAHRASTADVEAIVRKTAGDRLITANLDAVCAAIKDERYIQSVSVVRVLPDTLRVALVEREPAVVVRLSNGRLAWSDRDGHVLEDFKAENGEVPPPMAGFEDKDGSERAAAENRDRIAIYGSVQTALAQDSLWDRLDEVDVKYLKDVKVRLADDGVVVRLGDGDYRGRLVTALNLIDAVKRGDTELLARYRVPDIGRLLASADSLGTVDVTRSNGAVSIVISNGRSGPLEARRN